MSRPTTALRAAPRDPAQRARFLEELKTAYRQGQLHPTIQAADIDDRIVCLVFPHMYPPQEAAA